jgi:hypothetical protein
MTPLHAHGPRPETIVDYLRTTYPDTDVVDSGGAWFFSLDPERHWPNYATIVSTDDFDQASNLSRPGVFRLNIGVDRATFERVVGPAGELDESTVDYAVLDRVLPHPVYAAQRWMCILNPGPTTWAEVVIPLLAVAHDRLAAQLARQGRARPAG